MNAEPQISAPVDPYLERKALAAAGIWGRVKEMPNGCWEWQGGTTGGYGATHFGKQFFRIHRLVLEIFDGPLRVNEHACHACNNPLCINPRHIVRGTAKDNSGDFLEKVGRGRPRALTPEQIAEAKAIYTTDPISWSALGERFGVSGRVVQCAVLDQYGDVPKAASIKNIDELSAMWLAGAAFTAIAHSAGCMTPNPSKGAQVVSRLRRKHPEKFPYRRPDHWKARTAPACADRIEGEAK